ncbi:hypothetical protein IQ06DRAFT_144971 [Phaeosphaeriaceae sp. SRC1lsM3a]|nr:hypothetical protein IQ06DRAFT_144971 [Stagonospora sp. SRC1lsM3a]
MRNHDLSDELRSRRWVLASITTRVESKPFLAPGHWCLPCHLRSSITKRDLHMTTCLVVLILFTESDGTTGRRM